MPLAIALIVLVVGSLVFHFLSPWTFTPIASNWGMIDNTVDITLVVTGIVFVAVNLFMAYAIAIATRLAPKRITNPRTRNWKSG
jgi:cytochrome c oxidase subunit 2